MNTPNGSAAAAPLPRSLCTMPSCAGLAMPYVPFQQENPKQYAQDQALSAGTLFPGPEPALPPEDGEQHPAGHPHGPASGPGVRGAGAWIYLDTHLQDTEALALFRQYTAMEKAGPCGL